MAAMSDRPRTEVPYDAGRVNVATDRGMAEVLAELHALRRELQRQGDEVRRNAARLDRNMEYQSRDLTAHVELQFSRFKGWVLGCALAGILCFGAGVTATVCVLRLFAP